MLILGIETSCDETAAAIIDAEGEIHANVISSQIETHAAYGGVVPELAAREHLRNIDVVMNQVVKNSGVAVEDVDAVAVTCTPGLVPALLVGLSYAKGFAAVRGFPLIGVNHIVAHLYAPFMEHPRLMTDKSAFPVVGLVVSGGHTLLTVVNRDGWVQVLGQTLDDAAGEAFDKAAKILGLGYPGGPVIDRMAAQGDPETIDFPRGLMKKGGGSPRKRDRNRFNFSFSGLKTALYYQVKADTERSDADVKNLAASYQEAVVDVLVQKTAAAVQAYRAKTVVVAGGVACNSRLRHKLKALPADTDAERVIITSPGLCTDNAVMIAGYGYQLYKQNRCAASDLEAMPTCELDSETRLFGGGQ